jgi:hypothetical protein
VKLQTNNFSIQVDKSTDFTNESYVVALIRFVNDIEIKDKFFYLQRVRNTCINVFSSHLETKICLGRTV